MINANVGFCAIVFVLGVYLANASPHTHGGGQQLDQCAWGPTYWCGNLTNAKNCNAVRHCIQTVWEKQSVPVDDDSICKLCKDMVTEARNLLRSNGTMEELKEVVEFACNVFPIKIVAEECCDLADDFLAELVEALSSLMNPDQVCTIAGLCNNAKIDIYSSALDGTLEEKDLKLIKEIANRQFNECDGCKKYANEAVDKFKQANPEDMQETLIHWCGGLSSLSVGCSNIVATYFSEFHNHLNKHLNANGLCHLSGYCIASYHQHPEIDEPQEAKTDLADLLKITNKDDLPCKFCQQMVQHLRDVLIVNTTEEEFKMILNGFCNQTKGFRQECLSLVDQYYDIIYKNLVNNLDTNGICILIGVCPRISSKHSVILPVFPPAVIKITIKKKLGANEPKFTQEDLKSMQLPIDHLMGAANPNLLVENGELCVICEYVLHFIQDALATPSSADEIKHTVVGICKIMPKSIRRECHDFIDMYGDAIIALLIKELNPRTICPKMQLCPTSPSISDDVEVLRVKPYSDISDKSTCRFCLFVVTTIQEKIENDTSKENFKNVLDHLCVHWLEKQAECYDFAATYSNEIIDKLMTNGFTPNEICAAIKLCTNTNSYLSDLGISLENDDKSSSDELFNDISDSNKDLPVEIAFKQDQDAIDPNCWLCKEFVKNAEKRINKNMSKAKIEKALQHSCDKLRKSVQRKCHKYIDKYGDKIAALILKEMKPKMICRELGLCLWSEQEDLEIDEASKYDVIAMPNEELTKIGQSERLTSLSVGILKDPPTCVLCEFIMTKLEAELKDKSGKDAIKRAVEMICYLLPKTIEDSCYIFVENYANIIMILISNVPPKEICQTLYLCSVGLDKIVTDEVIECGICHGASMSLLAFFRQRTGNHEISQHDMVSVGCEQLPAKYYQICSEMITIYGQSILNLSQKSYMDETHVCAEIGKCFDSEKSGLAFARISE